MKRKIVLITGGNNGIGKATAIGLAQKGAVVTIACRNEAKGRAAVEDIKKAAKSDNVSLLLCDLSSLKSVKAAADSFKATHDHLDVLVNNAGVIVDKSKMTAEGFEWQFGVNHIGHFYLTKCLLELLLAADAPRVVSVSSGLHYSGELNFDTLRGEQKDYSSMKFYAQSKLANILFTKGLAKRYPKIMANTLHPGVVRTGFGNGDTAWYFNLMWTLMKPFLITPEKGAATSIYLASSPDVKVSGQYFEKCKEKKPSQQARDEALADKLWAYSEKEIA